MREDVVMNEGIVTQAPLICNSKVIYEVNIDGEDFIAESVGTQAVKDYLFIRRGQNVEIEGDISDKHMVVQKARIDISGTLDT